jgi:hypothetical protein
VQKLIDRIKEDAEEYGKVNGCYDSAAIYTYLTGLLEEVNNSKVSE